MELMNLPRVSHCEARQIRFCTFYTYYSSPGQGTVFDPYLSASARFTASALLMAALPSSTPRLRQHIPALPWALASETVLLSQGLRLATCSMAGEHPRWLPRSASPFGAGRRLLLSAEAWEGNGEAHSVLAAPCGPCRAAVRVDPVTPFRITVWRRT